MRYSASEKLEIIRLVEQSHLPVRRTLRSPRPDGGWAWFPSPRSLIRLGLKRNAAEVSLVVGYTINVIGLTAIATEKRRSPAHRRQHREAAGAAAWAPPIKSEA